MNSLTIKYLILAHRDPGQLARLVSRLAAPNSHVFIHIDKGINKTPFIAQLAGQSVHWVADEHRVNSIWGSIGAWDATYALLQQATQLRTDGNEYYCLLSGQDYPLRKATVIANFLGKHYGDLFIDINSISALSDWDYSQRFESYNFHYRTGTHFNLYPISDSRFFSKSCFDNYAQVMKRHNPISGLRTIFRRPRRHPEQIMPKGGSQWWALPQECINAIMAFLEKNPWFIKYHQFSHAPDEAIPHSVTGYLHGGCGNIKHSMTYANWSKPNVPLPATFETGDEAELEAAGVNFLFARKFEMARDVQILNWMDEHLLS